MLKCPVLTQRSSSKFSQLSRQHIKELFTTRFEQIQKKKNQTTTQQYLGLCHDKGEDTMRSRALVIHYCSSCCSLLIS